MNQLVHELLRQIKLAKEVNEKHAQQASSPPSPHVASNDFVNYTAQLTELLESAHANIISAKSAS